MLRVAVHNLSGETFAHIAEPGMSIEELKGILSQHWHVPPACQLLLFGTVPCKNDDLLEVHLAGKDDVALSLTMVVSLDAVHTALRNGSPRASAAALSALGGLGPQQGGASAIDAGIEALGHEDARVRQAAVAALSAMAEWGDGRAVEAVAACLEHEDLGTRRAAVKALARMAGSKARAIAAASARLEHGSAAVRRAAVEALARLAERGDPQVVASVGARLQHRDGAVRRTALEALSRLAERGDEPVVSAVSACLSAGDARMRRAAVDTLGFVAQAEHADAVQALCDCLRDHDGVVRRAAVDALASSTEVGDARTTNTVYECLDSGDAAIRRTALLAIPKVARRGDLRAVTAVCARLVHAEAAEQRQAMAALRELVNKGDEHCIAALCAALESMRSAAGIAFVLQALTLVANKGNSRARALACKLLAHGSPEVRKAASEVLVQLVDRGDEAAFAEVAAHLHHEDPAVVYAALELLPDLAAKDNDQALRELKFCIQHRQRAVKLAALHVLPKVVGKGDQRALSLVISCLTDEDCEIRLAGVRVVATIAERGDDQSVTAMRTRLKDRDPHVRKAAIDALEALTENGDARIVAGLCARLGDSVPAVRLAAVHVLDRVVVNADNRVIACLSACSEDADGAVRSAVAEALANIDCETVATVAAAATTNKPGQVASRRAAMEELTKWARQEKYTVVPSQRARSGQAPFSLRGGTAQGLPARAGTPGCMASATAPLLPPRAATPNANLPLLRWREATARGLEGALDGRALAGGSTTARGPPVHFGMFQARFVENLKWLSSSRYMELVAMCNCLPGPSSTQAAFAIGITQQGVLGGLAAGFMFLIPSAIVMTGLGFLSAYLKDQIEEPNSSANAVAICASAVGVALVFIAVSGLVKKNVEGAKLGAICFGTAAACIVVSPQPAWMNPALIMLGGLITALFPIEKPSALQAGGDADNHGLSASAGVLIFVLYLALAAWTIYDAAVDRGWIISFLTAGMFVWGGGPVVLPMLMTVLTPTWIQQTIFLTGIALAEMMPGPVFNLSCFLGVQLSLANGFPWPAGTFLCWISLMGPGVVLTFGAMPLWGKLRSFAFYGRALPGLNAAAVGLLVSTIFVVNGALEARSPWPAGSRAVALCAYAAIELGKVDVPTVVLVAALVGLAWSAAQ